MLRVAEHWADSDIGRQRQGNEDSFFARSPLFVVADGMGGAQAGEVASDTAVRAFRSGLPGGPPAQTLVGLIEQANREIHDRSRADAQMAGMGTTLTAAYLAEDDAVVVAHVGDSRCYLLRGGDLVRLTRDHSLVGELVARGKLTEEQAETHPQRSVITRALGPEPHVEVDVEAFPARDGDVFMLCSDGLTSMVHEPRLQPILAEASSLEDAGRSLIQAANAAGGRDNITVVLFRIEDVDGAAGAVTEEAETGEYEAVGARAAGDQRTQVQDQRALRTADIAEALREAEERDNDARHFAPVATRTRPEPAPPSRPAREVPGPAPPGPRAKPARRFAGAWKYAAVALVLLLMVLAAGWSASRAVFFIGVDPEDRTVTMYQGLPYDLPLGIELYRRYAGSGVTIDAVPASRRGGFTDHQLRSRDAAEELIIDLERGQIQP